MIDSDFVILEFLRNDQPCYFNKSFILKQGNFLQSLVVEKLAQRDQDTNIFIRLCDPLCLVLHDHAGLSQHEEYGFTFFEG